MLSSLAWSKSDSPKHRIDRPHVVEDPIYGEILFEYYQKRYFAAMTSILIGLETGGLPTQRERARVLLGALYATYGMPSEAEALFNELLHDAVDPSLATRVWIHLSNLYYQQQRYQKALDTLNANVTRAEDVPKDLRQNYYALRTRILMKLGRYEDTGAALDGMQDASTLSGYLRYNLAVSRINIGQGKEGEALLWQLVNLEPGDEEVNSLKDKAILALGVYYLRNAKPRQAQHVLGSARLHGPFSETGMLLHARAWLATREPLKAIGSLEQLSQRSMQYEEAQEAAIALPFLYEQLGDFGKAQSGYRNSIRAYTEHYRYLSELEEKIRSGVWFAELAQEPSWSTAMDPLPSFEPRRVDSFATFQHLFTKNIFHTRWLDYHEQWRQIRLLEQWQQRLPAMDELLAAHISKHREQTPEALALLRETDLARLPERIVEMTRRYTEAVTQENNAEFATSDQERLLAGLAKAQENAQRWRDKVPPSQQEKIEFYQRVLQWDLAENIIPLQWQREKELQQLGDLAKQSADLYRRVDWAAKGDLNRITTLGQQLAGMHNDVVALEARGYDLLTRQQHGIESLALDQVEFTRTRLRAFTAECWAALADLQHRALREKYKGVDVPLQGVPVEE
jgi:tetratricopeptide (TPR) repeat protein